MQLLGVVNASKSHVLLVLYGLWNLRISPPCAVTKCCWKLQNRDSFFEFLCVLLFGFTDFCGFIYIFYCLDLSVSSVKTSSKTGWSEVLNNYPVLTYSLTCRVGNCSILHWWVLYHCDGIGPAYIVAYVACCQVYDLSFTVDLEPLVHIRQLDPSLNQLVNQSSITVLRLIKFAKRLDEFARLPQVCQIGILKGCWIHILLLRSVSLYDCHRDVWVTPRGDIPTEILKVRSLLFLA